MYILTKFEPPVFEDQVTAHDKTCFQKIQTLPGNIRKESGKSIKNGKPGITGELTNSLTTNVMESVTKPYRSPPIPKSNYLNDDKSTGYNKLKKKIPEEIINPISEQCQLWYNQNKDKMRTTEVVFQ